jgi:uncharacterized coiled-coil DUF342 family protein
VSEGETLKADIDRAISERDQCRSNFDELQAQRDRLIFELGELTIKHDEYVNNHNIMLSNYNAHASELAGSLSARNNLNAKYEELSSERDQLHKDVANAIAERDHFVTRCEHLLSECKRLAMESDEFSSARDLLVIQCESLTAERNQLISDLAEIHRRNSRSLLNRILSTAPQFSSGSRTTEKSVDCCLKQNLLKIGFDLQFYYETNQDVASSGCDAIEHYISYGRSEGRPIRLIQPASLPLDL